jgi:hypothetical protein
MVKPWRLVVFYDGQCSICRAARSWLMMQPQLVTIDFEMAGSAQARRLFPGLDHDATLRDITVVADFDDGRHGRARAVYVGDAAWLMCLWALDSYRAMSIRLAQPALRGTARQVVAMASGVRNWLKEDGYRDGCEADACATG